MHLIEINHVKKAFDDTIALNDVSFYVDENEFVTLLGPSGCGKTTLLRILGGFEDITDGTITLNGKSLIDVPPYDREINTVFQNYALFPHLNVYENVAFGLKMKKMPSKDIEKQVNDSLKMVRLENYSRRKINQLSGGQKQRVAIARAIVNQPKVLLLDEPLAALDLKLRQDMQYELKELQRRLGITFIYVTHDQEEALTMSDTIVVMNQGNILQIGSPVDIYNEPKTKFVAHFIGESNIIKATMIKDYLVEFEGHEYECVDKGFNKNQPVSVVIRPEDITLKKEPGYINGIVDAITFKGVHYEIIVYVNEKEYVIHSIYPAKVNDKVSLHFDKEAIHVMQDV
jgi:spermidine/putrescine transport system ATP-binding protein